MSATQYLLESLTRHQVFVQQHGGRIANTATEQLEQMLDRINSQIVGESPSRLFRASQAIEQFILEELQPIQEQVQADLFDFAEYEVGFTERMFANAVTVSLETPAPTQVAAALTNATMRLVSGDSEQLLTINQMFDRYKSKYRRDISNSIRDGIVTGATTDEIVRDVGAKGKRAKQDLRAVILTATNKAGSVARSAFYQENSDVIEKERWVSTLDSRTTILCAGRDSKLFPVGEGPHPPAHYRCRSIRVPDVDEEYAIPGLEGTRSSVYGPVNSRTTYNSFLKRQSKEFQDAVLGPKRAAMFRAGMNVDKFTDDFGRTIDLADLQLSESMTL